MNRALVVFLLSVSGVVAEPGLCGRLVAESGQHVLLTSADGVLVVRLDVRINGLPCEQVWRRYAHQLYRQLDADQDGQVRGNEVSLPEVTRSLARCGFVIPLDARQRLAGRLSDPLRESEMAEVIRRFGSRPTSLRNPRPAPAATTANLFFHLDQDKNGKLSPREMTLNSHLLRLDLDDDGTLSDLELQAAGRVVPASRSPGEPPETTINLLDTANSPTRIVQQLIRHFDGRMEQGDSALDPREIAMPAHQFKRLDADQDGRLDFTELNQWLRHPVPDLTIVVRLGSQNELQHHVAAVWATPAEHPPASLHLSSEFATLIQDEVQVEIGRVENNRADGIDLRDLFQTQFENADRDSNRYLLNREVQRHPLFGSTFQAMDQNADRRIGQAEMARYVRWLQLAAESHVILSTSNSGATFFGIVDGNGDRRVTGEELERARRRIPIWDRDGDGSVAAAEISRQIRLTVALGLPNLFGSSLAQAAAAGSSGIPVTDLRPVWLKNVDRNRDSEISRREFLGPLEDFERLDTNGNGVVEMQEALARLPDES